MSTPLSPPATPASPRRVSEPSRPRRTTVSSTETALHQRFVCRTAGLSASTLEALRAPATLEALGRARPPDEAASDITIDSWVATLHDAVGGESDKALRRALLGLKRDVHNGRTPRHRDLDAATSALDSSVVDALRRLRDEADARSAALEAARVAHARELTASRRRLAELVADEAFGKGLLLSSRSLSRGVERYRRADLSKPNAKIRQVERGLLRYLTRAARKATPFSTFCTLLPGRRLAEAGPPKIDATASFPTFDASPRPARSHVRLDKGLYARMQPLLAARPAIRRHLHVEANPTLQLESVPADEGDEGDARWLFLAARSADQEPQGRHSPGRARAREMFQRLAPNPALTLFLDMLDGGHRAWGELVDALAAHPSIDADVESAAAYVDRLLEIGFLRFRFGISEQEVRWDEPLAAWLEEVAHAEDESVARDVAAHLRRLRDASDRYAVAPLAERPALLDEARTLVGELFARLAPSGTSGPIADPPPPFYEDAAGEATLTLDARVGLPTALTDRLEEYTRLTLPLAYPRRAQATMRHVFDQHFPSDHSQGSASLPRAVPLLRFYETYSREHFKDHLELQRRAPRDRRAVNPFELELIDRLDEAHGRLARTVAERWRRLDAADPDAEIVLTRDDFEEVLETVPTTAADGPSIPTSVSFFAQLLPSPAGASAESASDERDRLVVRSYLAGYGKYFSRFLHLLPDDVLDDLRASNERLAARVDLAEICGDASFNANLHPPLLPRELSYPTGETGDAAQLPASEIVVTPDPDDPHRLRLVHEPTGRQIVPVDLGFMNPRMRPPLFQLLSRFTPVVSFNLSFPETLRGEGAPDGVPDDAPDIAVRPRITYHGDLVLARRQWRMDGAALPTPEPSEDAFDHFARVDAWRRRLGLPPRVFLRLKPRGHSPRQHLHKPQFLDFESPLLVELFGRIGDSLADTPFHAVFEECLPDDRHLVRGPSEGDGDDDADETRWATELILQLDLHDRTDGGGAS